MLEKVCRSKSLGCNAGFQEASGYYTSGEFEESILYKGDEVRKRGILPGFETQGGHHQKFKIGLPLGMLFWTNIQS